MKKIIKIAVAILLVIVIIALGYVGYVVFSYSRIEDNVALDVKNGSGELTLATNQEYTIVSQNLGFGAYTADFTFFMDGGKESRAKNESSVKSCINTGALTVADFNPDFVLFQEVDTDSTRSYHVDQRELLYDRFTSYFSTFAVNYHSAYLFYPILQPHGASNSGIMTLSKYKIDSGLRRSFPISTSFSKFLDLDRCYSVSRLTVGNKELLLYNVHASAYGGSDEIRTAQMSMLFNDMLAEFNKGNYCVCGGDFNHDFTGNSTNVLNGESVDFGWAQPFPINLLPEGLTRADNYSEGLKPTCRNCDIPYEEGNFTIIVDGFICSNNVTVTYLDNYQTGFSYSDHSPVVMKFLMED